MQNYIRIIPNLYRKKTITAILIGKIILMAISVLTIRIITEFLSTEQVGSYYILLSTFSLFAFLFYNPIGQYFSRNLILWQDNGTLKNAVTVMISLRILTIPIITVLAASLYEILNYKQYFSFEEYLLIIIASILASFHGVLLDAVNILRSQIRFVIWGTATMLTALAVSMVLLYINQTATSWLIGLFIVQIIFCAFMYQDIIPKSTYQINNFQKIFNKLYLFKITSFILPVTVTLLLQWGQNSFYRIAIENLYSIELLAFVAVGMSISSSIMYATESVTTQILKPIYLRQITNVTHVMRLEAWQSYAKMAIPTYVVAAMFVIIFAPFLTTVLVADKFHDAYIFAMCGAMFELLRSSTNVIYMVSQSEYDTKTTVTPYLLGFIAMLIGLYTIDARHEPWKIVLIVAAAQCVTCVFLFRNMRKLLKINLSLRKPILVACLSLPLVFLQFFFKEHSISMALLIIACGVIYLLLLLHFINKYQES